MAGKLEIIVAHVGKAGAATALVDQYNTNKDGFALIGQSAQTVAAVASIASIVAITPGLMPFVSTSAHIFAGTVTFLKIVAESKTDQGFDNGDVISLVGNVAGVVGSIVLLGGFAAGAAPLAVGAILIGGASVLTSNVVKDFLKTVVLPFWEQNFRDQPDATYADHWVSPDLKLVPLSQIQTYYQNNIGMVIWDPVTNAISVGSVPWDKRENPSKEEGSSSGSDHGGSGSASVPVIPQVPPPVYEEATVTIGITQINGESVMVPPITETVPPLTEEERKEPQDSYGCCTGGQDSYS